MKSWTDWKDLTSENIHNDLRDAKGVYVIRKKGNVETKQSDIIYIGHAGRGNQGIGKRLKNLLTALKSPQPKPNLHYAAGRIRKHFRAGLQFSWLECFHAPDGVEKALLLAFWISTGELPLCNKEF